MERYKEYLLILCLGTLIIFIKVYYDFRGHYLFNNTTFDSFEKKEIEICNIEETNIGSSTVIRGTTSSLLFGNIFDNNKQYFEISPCNSNIIFILKIEQKDKIDIVNRLEQKEFITVYYEKRDLLDFGGAYGYIHQIKTKNWELNKNIKEYLSNEQRDKFFG